MSTKKNNQQNNLGPGLRIFSEISTWVVGPIILALIVGKGLDSHFGTKPWIFLGLAALGFLVTVVGMVKVVKRYGKEIKKAEELSKDQNKN